VFQELEVKKWEEVELSSSPLTFHERLHVVSRSLESLVVPASDPKSQLFETPNRNEHKLPCNSQLVKPSVGDFEPVQRRV
jgi:hypothetical protein